MHTSLRSLLKIKKREQYKNKIKYILYFPGYRFHVIKNDSPPTDLQCIINTNQMSRIGLNLTPYVVQILYNVGYVIEKSRTYFLTIFVH